MFFVLLGLGMTVLIFFIPHLMRLRIRILRWLRLEGLARFVEERFDGFVLCLRLVVAAIAVIFFALAVAA